jgi:hypothetical protein
MPEGVYWGYELTPEIARRLVEAGHAHAAAVSAADNADIQKLYLDAVEQAAANADEVLRLRERIKVLEEALQFIASHDLDGADDRARAIICGLFIIKAKKALAARAALGDKTCQP